MQITGINSITSFTQSVTARHHGTQAAPFDADSHMEFHGNPINDLVARTRSEREGRSWVAKCLSFLTS